ncbi:MAG: FliA/WhiG family RNA polymerase sigma factor [Candidatus Gastranaerophilales bacterium]|nr:FliA/WhiG family RNA polymerase sigma factor [Candidatus Gastranaerophilales bacterium]
MSNDTEYNSYKNIKRLSDEELEKLWAAYSRDKSNKKLRDLIIIQYIYLTKYVIGRIKLNIPTNFAIEDIASFGVEGLIDAIEKYSPEKGAHFETYAIMRIKGSIIDKVRSQDWLPRSTRKKIKDIRTVAEQLKQKLGRTPTTSEIANSLGIEKEKVVALLSEDASISSLYDKKYSGDEGIELIDTIEDTNYKNPLEKLEERDVKNELQSALQKLPERERLVMVLYYHENMTLKEIGENIDVSESRVCQIHAQAIMKLRNILNESRCEYLLKD